MSVVKSDLMLIEAIIICRAPVADLFALKLDLADARAALAANVIGQFHQLENILLQGPLVSVPSQCETENRLT